MPDPRPILVLGYLDDLLLLRLGGPGRPLDDPPERQRLGRRTGKAPRAPDSTRGRGALYFAWGRDGV